MSDKLGLVSFQGGSEYQKSYSEETATEIDEEVKRIVDDCYNETKELLESKRELIEKLAEELLEHESINLPQIMKVLGDRPYPLKETIKDYLEELNKRQEEEEQKKELDAAEAAMKATEEPSEDQDNNDGEAAAAKKEDDSTEATEENAASKDESVTNIDDVDTKSKDDDKK